MTPHQPIAQESAKRSRPMSQRIGAIALSVLIASGCAFIKIKFGSPAIAQASAAEASPWVLLSGEKPALSLDQTPFAGQPTENNAYGHTNGSRTDWVQSGLLALDAPNITVLIARQTQPKPIRYSVVRNLEDLSELKLVQHQYRPMYYALDTRFGELRGVIFDVNADGIKKRCVGFHKPMSNRVFVKGFVCGRDQAEDSAKGGMPGRPNSFHQCCGRRGDESQPGGWRSQGMRRGAARSEK